jgi:hypothetical protein
MKLTDILLEVINHKKVIDGLFQEVPEMASIGTKEQYASYLETIFPNSKIKDIVYHGGTLNPRDRGKDEFTGKHGIYLTKSKYTAGKYLKSNVSRVSGDYIDRRKLFTALVNIENPLDPKYFRWWKYGLDSIGDKEYEVIKKYNADGLIDVGFLSKINLTHAGTQIVVFSTDQIHILGSKDDMEKFKQYVKDLF